MRNGTAVAVAAVALGLAACSGPSGGGPTEAQNTFLTTSGAIDGRLTGDSQTTLKLGQTICAELAAGKPVAEVVADAQRFTQGEGVISRDQATKLVTAAKQHLCT